ncbi:hypothetical protein MKT11_008535 [Providencia rettgeri]|uniref:hypothetical protein n=1 Tax=Providencia sp. PROV035 TaxID=2949766 RepID=UPI0023497C70|nr:hypothetical protein [Providencia sp. PROV035]MCL0019113.1 hypothetical protein [Providencia rettgeri]
MALHPHVGEFYAHWLEKSDGYKDETISSYFNKSFSLFVLYNKLYAEATFILNRRGEIEVNQSRGFPDRRGATSYAPQYIGHVILNEALNNDRDCSESINELIRLIINENFYIKLKLFDGTRQPEKDMELVSNIQSDDVVTRVEGILDLIYSVRCNMFHGNKNYQQVQIELLKPVTIILRKVIEVLYTKLSSD